MLLWMREGAGAGVIKLILMSLLVMAVAGLVLMDVGGFFRGNISSGTIVKGGGLNISAVEFDRIARRALASQGLGPEEAYRLGLIDNIVQSEIQSRLFSQAASDLGLKVGDDAVRKQIADMAAQLTSNGQSKEQMVRQILRTQGISESEFVAAIRQETANNLLRAGLTAPSTLSSPLLAENLYRYDNEKRAADIIVLTNAGVEGIEEPTEENLRKYYDANKMDYLIPETRTVTVATLKPDMLAKNLVITDEELRTEYDRNIAAFTKPARREVEQAVFSDEAAARKTADSVASGQSLKSAAPKDAYVGVQDYEQTGLLPEIAKPVFSADKGELVGPVQTSLGWHVLVVKDILAESVTPFENVKEKLKKELEQIALTDEMFETGNTIEDRAAAGESLETLVAEYGMTTQKIGPFRVNGTNADKKDLFKSYAADRDKFIQTAFDYEEGEIAPIIETADGQFHVIRIDDVTPDAYRDFASVKDGLQKRWIAEQRRLANQARAKTILDAVNGGMTLKDASEKHGGTLRRFPNINRKEAPAAPLTPVVAAQIFSTDKGAYFSSEIDNGFVVGQVTDIALPESVPASGQEMADLSDLVGKSLPQDIFAQYVSSLAQDKKIRINQHQLQQMYSGLGSGQ